MQERLASGFETVGTKRSTIIFHDAFAYLEAYAPIEVEEEVEVEGDESALSASELAEVIETIKEKGITFIIAEEQHKHAIADRIAEETGCEVLILDSLVTGDGSKDAWIDGMNENLDKLLAAMGAR